jgi:hypothetical protein
MTPMPTNNAKPLGLGIWSDIQRLDKNQMLLEYVGPMVALLRNGSSLSVEHRLEDRPIQAVIARLENRQSVCELLLKAWYPYRYQVVAVEELNEIAAGHSRNVRNIGEAVEDSEFFVVDMSNVDSVRARSGFGEYDDAALVRFIEENMEYVGSKVLVVLDRRAKLIERVFPRFCEFAKKNGIEVFDQGKYRQIGGRK